MSVSITGADKIISNLTRINRQFENKVVRPAMFEALKPIQTAAKTLQRHASLKKLIGRKASMSKQKGKGVIGKVFMRPAKNRTIQLEGRTVGFEVVGNILEFGSIKQHISPQPFMRPARDMASPAARMILSSQISKRLKAI